MTGQALVLRGDALHLPLADGSVDAIVTDPPYNLAFMGATWDTVGDANAYQAWCEQWARGALRVLKPGGHLLAFGSTRTYHRLAAGIEDAGFEARDTIAHFSGQELPAPAAWVTGQGFPKHPSALKPAHEPIVCARKPLAGTVAANVLAHGTGALNIDACRIPVADASYADNHSGDRGHDGTRAPQDTSFRMGGGSASSAGRWPANVVLSHAPGCQPTGTRKVRGTAPPGRPTQHATITGRPIYGGYDRRVHKGSYADLDGTETVQAWRCVEGCPVAELDRQSGELVSGANPTRRASDKFRDVYGDFAGQERCTAARGLDQGGASRFFYTAKAASAERVYSPGGKRHPTQKPLGLMRWLVRLVTPPGGTLLDPFCGSGTTGEAAVVEGFRAVLIDLDAEWLPIARARCHPYRRAQVHALRADPATSAEPVQGRLL